MYRSHPQVQIQHCNGLGGDDGGMLQWGVFLRRRIWTKVLQPTEIQKQVED